MLMFYLINFTVNFSHCLGSFVTRARPPTMIGPSGSDLKPPPAQQKCWVNSGARRIPEASAFFLPFPTLILQVGALGEALAAPAEQGAWPLPEAAEARPGACLLKAGTSPLLLSHGR